MGEFQLRVGLDEREGGAGSLSIADGAEDVDEEGRPKGFNDIVFGAQPEASQPRILVFDAGQHNDADVLGFRVCLQHAEDVSAVDGLADVQEDDGRVVLFGHLHHLGRGGVGDDGHAEFFGFAHDGGDEERVIIRDEDMGGRAHIWHRSKK